jgi:O-antigen ligase/tetratricopeptide (TPR) repeat protein
VTKLSFALFLSALIFAPLAFGTVEPWSLLIVQLLIAAAVFAFCLQLPKATGKLLHVPGLLPLLLLIGWIAIQLVPLPAALIKVLSPATYQVYQPIHALLGNGSWMVLSVYPKATALEGLRISAYVLFYVLTVQLLSHGGRLKRTVMICSWLAAAVGLVAILQKFSSPGKIYWLRAVTVNATPAGPWINRSQFCGYAGMVAPLVLALALYYRPLVGSGESLRRRIVAFFSGDDGGNLHILLGFGLLVLASSIFITLSRGGIIAFSLSMLVFFLLLAWKEAKYSSLWFFGVFFLLLLAVSWFGWQPIIERFDQIFTSSGELAIDRFRIWENGWQLAKDFWLTGSGFGTFIAVFPHYRTFPGEEIYDHAHNDYLELLSDGGVIGFVLAACFVLAVIRAGWMMLRRRRDRYAILVSIGALAGISAVLIHGVSDFNLHNPAVGLYFFFICGLLVAAGNTRFYYRLDTTLLAASSWLSPRRLLAAGTIYCCAVLLVPGGALLAGWQYHRVRDIYLSRQLSEKYLDDIFFTLRQAARLDPLEGLYPYMQGEVQRFGKDPDKALASYLSAGRKDPLDGAILQRIALMLPKERHQDAAWLLEIGAERSLNKEQLMLTRVQWLLENEQRIKAIEVLRGSIAEKTGLVTVVLPLLQSFAFTREELVAVLPHRVASWLECGAYLEKSGSLEDAAYCWDHAFDYLDNENKLLPIWFSRLYEYYKRHKEEEKGLAVLRLGIERLPEYPRFHEWLGDYYAGAGIIYRAVEEYRQAQLLEPTNASIRQKIDKLSDR